MVCLRESNWQMHVCSCISIIHFLKIPTHMNKCSIWHQKLFHATLSYNLTNCYTPPPRGMFLKKKLNKRRAPKIFNSNQTKHGIVEKKTPGLCKNCGTRHECQVRSGSRLRTEVAEAGQVWFYGDQRINHRSWQCQTDFLKLPYQYCHSLLK